MNSAKRTAAIHLGFGSAADKSFRGYEYAANYLADYDDKNYTRYSTAHPQLDGVMYFDKHT